jgi:hypothetical protein
MPGGECPGEKRNTEERHDEDLNHEHPTKSGDTQVEKWK